MTIEKTKFLSKRTLLKKFDKHKMPLDSLNRYCRGKKRGAFFWQLRNPRLLLRPMEIERPQGPVSWVQLPPTTLEQLSNRPTIVATPAMRNDLLRDMEAAAEMHKMRAKRAQSQGAERNVKQKFSDTMEAQGRDFWTTRRVSHDLDITFNMIKKIGAWQLFKPSSTQSNLFLRLLHRICKNVSFSGLAERRLRKLRKVFSLELEKQGNNLAVGSRRNMEKILERIDETLNNAEDQGEEEEEEDDECQT